MPARRHGLGPLPRTNNTPVNNWRRRVQERLAEIFGELEGVNALSPLYDFLSGGVRQIGISSTTIPQATLVNRWNISSEVGSGAGYESGLQWITAEAGDDLYAGQVVFLEEDLASSYNDVMAYALTAGDSERAVGLVISGYGFNGSSFGTVADPSAGDEVWIATEGVIDIDNWGPALESGDSFLQTGSPYFLSEFSPGQLTDSPPTNTGDLVQPIGWALSPQQMKISADAPSVELTSSASYPKPVGLNASGQLEEITISSTVDELVITLQNKQGSTVSKCQPLYLSGPSQFQLAQADADATSQVVGLLSSTSLTADSFGAVVIEGILAASTGQWDAQTGGSGGLTPGEQYFLDPSTAGKLVEGPSGITPGVGESVVRIGKAVSTTSMRIKIEFVGKREA